MKHWRRKKQHSRKQQILYEREQLAILLQGIEQGYSLMESLQCMSAFAPPSPWEEMQHAIQIGADWEALFELLRFRSFTKQLLCFESEWQEITLTVQKIIVLLDWELEIREQLGKTFAYPVVLLLIMVFFACVFEFGLLPQLDFFIHDQTIWLFIVPKMLFYFLIICSIVLVTSQFYLKNCSFQKKRKIFQWFQNRKLIQLIICLRLALHCQLTLNQGQPLTSVFTKNEHTSDFFGQLLNSMHCALANGEQLQQVMKSHGFCDDTWLSFFQWQPTNAQILIASEFYWHHGFRQLQQLIQKWCQIGQVIFFLTIGIILLQFYLSLFLPIFDMMYDF